MRGLPDKLFFRIGEVSDLVGVKPHVLRYWETEFGCLRPMKTRGAHRQYRRRDVELAALIRRLLQDEGYTISGAKRRLKELGHTRGAQETVPAPAGREVSMRAVLLEVRGELCRLRDTLDASNESEERARQEPQQVTVHAAVPVARRRR